MARIYPSARERILDGAERVILRDGLGRLSVDAVLAEVGVSKGGFFHHFATKNELLGAITERLSTHVNAQIERAAARDQGAGNRLLRAQIELVFGMHASERERLRALVLALVEAAGSNPAVAAKVRAANRRALAADMTEGVPVGRALMIQLALDGYWLGESLGTLALSASQRTAFRRALLDLTRPDTTQKSSKPKRTRKR